MKSKLNLYYFLIFLDVEPESRRIIPIYSESQILAERALRIRFGDKVIRYISDINEFMSNSDTIEFLNSMIDESEPVVGNADKVKSLLDDLFLELGFYNSIGYETGHISVESNRLVYKEDISVHSSPLFVTKEVISEDPKRIEIFELLEELSDKCKNYYM